MSETTAGRRRVTSVVAIPVCNEEERIGRCLAALAMQTDVDVTTVGVLLFLNNCTDKTATVVGAADYPFSLRVIERTDAKASAGWARRIAMDEAAAWLREASGGGGILLTTDADSSVPPDWLSRNIAAIHAGADAAAGRLELDPLEAAQLPAALHERGRLEGAYESLLAELCARLDPQPGNPWPNHWCKSGATIAVTIGAYEAVGGMPDQPTGEDRAFIDALVANNHVVRHDPSIVVVTSGRLTGRATGGVADTLRLRCNRPASPCDDRLEIVSRVLMRCSLRRRLKELWRDGRFADASRWAPGLQISEEEERRIATARFFEEAYAAMQAASPLLQFRPIIPNQLRSQIWIARLVLQLVRSRDRMAAYGERRRRRSQGPIGTTEVETIASGRLAPCGSVSESSVS